MKRTWMILFLLLVWLAVPPAGADEQGSFRFIPYAGGAMGIQMIDITVDKDAGVMSLQPVCDVTDVVIERLQMDAYMTATEVFRANRLDSHQVINLHAYLYDVLPAFRVTCVNGAGETERWYLSDSGEDGSLRLLSPASVEPSLPDIFQELAGIEFTFSSGAGAWYTSLTLTNDGRFTGEHHDSEMGETSEAYPNGSEYGCIFHGRLFYAGQLNEHAFTLFVESVENDEGQLSELIADGVRYVTTAPYGLEHAETLILYTPGCPLEQLPEGLLPWLHLEDAPSRPSALPAYALYNAAEECGFVGIPTTSSGQ